MSFTLFSALQIFKLTMKLTVQPASLELGFVFAESFWSFDTQLY